MTTYEDPAVNWYYGIILSKNSRITLLYIMYKFLRKLVIVFPSTIPENSTKHTHTHTNGYNDKALALEVDYEESIFEQIMKCSFKKYR